jgi:hypothetical protein
MTRPTRIESHTALRTPGLLLEPFQWAARPILCMALAEPRLLAHLTEIDALRLHVIAFYLTHRGDHSDSGADAIFLASARSRDIAERALGKSPKRLLGLLRRLPDKALERATYEQLASLASSEALVDALMRKKRIDLLLIEQLATIPPELRDRPLLRAIDCDMDKLMSVADVAAWFAHRWGINASNRFAAVRAFAELGRLTSELLRTLPPIPRLPPRIVACANIIETPQELRRAGRIGRNCLGVDAPIYASQMARFKTFIYIWDDGDAPIFIRLKRYEGLGWFIAEIKVAGNKTPPEERRQVVGRAFEAAGIDWGSVADNLHSLLLGAYGVKW